jgi:hypothetical protein
VVRENDSCSLLRRIMSATPPPRAAAISSILVDALLPIRNARWNDDHQSRSARNSSPRRPAAARKSTGRSFPRQTRRGTDDAHRQGHEPAHGGYCAGATWKVVAEIKADQFHCFAVGGEA